MAAKAPTLRDLEDSRQAATLLASVRHLETATVDDALDLLDVLMASKLLARASRMGREEKLKSLPRLRRAAAGFECGALIRPDGCVAWALPTGQDLDATTLVRA